MVYRITKERISVNDLLWLRQSISSYPKKQIALVFNRYNVLSLIAFYNFGMRWEVKMQGVAMTNFLKGR
jgi:hypothetical protein